MQAAPGAGVQQGEAVVAAVADDDVAGAQGAQVVAGRPALVLVAGEVEVEGQAGAQLEQAAEQALGVMGAVRGAAVAVAAQPPGQMDLGAVDGADAVPAPQPARCVGGDAGEQGALHAEEGPAADLAAGHAHRGGGDGIVVGREEPLLPALAPQCGERRAIALQPGGQHKAEDEQHDEQRVHFAAALHPLPVVAAQPVPDRGQQVLPQRGELAPPPGRVGGDGPRTARGAAACGNPVAGAGPRPAWGLAPAGGRAPCGPLSGPAAASPPPCSRCRHAAPHSHTFPAGAGGCDGACASRPAAGAPPAPARARQGFSPAPRAAQETSHCAPPVADGRGRAVRQANWPRSGGGSPLWQRE